MTPPQPPHGRGSPVNPQNRFERLRVVDEPDMDRGYVDPEEEQRPLPRTVFLKDLNTTVLAKNESPDMGAGYGLNPYRGCEHGCAYCYARPYHEYLGFSPGLDFETKILVKADAPRLLRAELSDPKWKPRPVMMSGLTDCYQPAERRIRVTRGCLEVFADFHNPFGLITKNHLITRDIDILQDLASHRAVSACISVTSLDPELSRKLEPRASLPALRLAAVEKLAAAGIPVTVNVAPIIPGLNDHEVPKIIQAAAAAGACGAGYTLVRFPYGVKEVFLGWLDAHYPEKKEGILARIRSHREGKLTDSEWGTRMTGTGVYAESVASFFEVWCRKAGFAERRERLSTAAFRRPGIAEQIELL